jgi:hypothetical protein
MKNLILAATAIAAISFTTSTATARHLHRRVVRHHGHVPHVVRHHVVPHHAYRHVPVYSGRYHAYPAHHGYHYARPHYSSGGISVNGRHLSLYIGF